VLDGHGNQLSVETTEPLAELKTVQPFHSVIAVSFLFGGEWKAAFSYSTRRGAGKTGRASLPARSGPPGGPAVYNVYLLHRLRRRAAPPNALGLPELHDGAVQSLIAVEMQVDVLRRQANADGPIGGELGRIQGLLREEVLKLRELMQQMKAIDVDAQKLLGVLHDTVERFQRETGISARFVADVEELDMPQKICRELVRIVQEGLVNVRKHSRARHALIRLGSSDSQWSLVLEDDGQGFPFSGRFTQHQLDEIGKGPMIIKERVRLIAGELTVESTSGQGTRLEITIPRGDVLHEF